jgi:hypothetical protein
MTEERVYGSCLEMGFRSAIGFAISVGLAGCGGEMAIDVRDAAVDAPSVNVTEADAAAPDVVDAATDARDDTPEDVSDECRPFDAGCPQLAPDPLSRCTLGCGQTMLLCNYFCGTFAVCGSNGVLWTVRQALTCPVPVPDAAPATVSDASGCTCARAGEPCAPCGCCSGEVCGGNGTCQLGAQ